MFGEPYRSPDDVCSARRGLNLRAHTSELDSDEAEVHLFQPGADGSGVGSGAPGAELRSLCPGRAAQPAARTFDSASAELRREKQKKGQVRDLPPLSSDCPVVS